MTVPFRFDSYHLYLVSALTSLPFSWTGVIHESRDSMRKQSWLLFKVMLLLFLISLSESPLLLPSFINSRKSFKKFIP